MPNILRTLSTFPQRNVTETQVISGATHPPSLIQRETWSSNRASVFTTRCGNSLSCRYLPCTNPQMDTCQHQKTPIFHIQPAVSIILHDTTCIKPSQFVYILPRFPAYLELLPTHSRFYLTYLRQDFILGLVQPSSTHHSTVPYLSRARLTSSESSSAVRHIFPRLSRPIKTGLQNCPVSRHQYHQHRPTTYLSTEVPTLNMTSANPWGYASITLSPERTVHGTYPPSNLTLHYRITNAYSPVQQRFPFTPISPPAKNPPTTPSQKPGPWTSPSHAPQQLNHQPASKSTSSRTHLPGRLSSSKPSHPPLPFSPFASSSPPPPATSPAQTSSPSASSASPASSPPTPSSPPFSTSHPSLPNPSPPATSPKSSLLLSEPLYCQMTTAPRSSTKRQTTDWDCPSSSPHPPPEKESPGSKAAKISTASSEL